MDPPPPRPPVQMLKAFAPVLTMLLLFVFKLELCTARLVAAVMMVTIAMVITVVVSLKTRLGVLEVRGPSSRTKRMMTVRMTMMVVVRTRQLG